VVIVRPSWSARLFYRADAEDAHGWAIRLLALLPTAAAPAGDSRLAMTVAGLRFAHPVCLAAGFDKDARAVHATPWLGFAGAEVGTLTPLPQAGNPRPRLFRLTADSAVINRMGFNNAGQADAAARLSRLRARAHRPLIGVNVGANKDAVDRVADYVTGVAAMAPLADWLTINISSPNTPGLRALQDEGALDALLAGVAGARPAAGPPLFLKVAPDLSDEQIEGIVRAAMTHRLDAIIMGNTTISRPPLHSPDAGEGGGLSGAPLAPLALDRLRVLRAASGGAIPLIAAGGIASAADAWARLRAGASLVQLYSALVYEGPLLARRIVRGLRDRLEAAGAERIADIIGADAPPPL
jgi:dihydroorotate dehydrogenase